MRASPLFLSTSDFEWAFEHFRLKWFWPVEGTRNSSSHFKRWRKFNLRDDYDGGATRGPYLRTSTIFNLALCWYNLNFGSESDVRLGSILICLFRWKEKGNMRVFDGKNMKAKWICFDSRAFGHLWCNLVIETPVYVNLKIAKTDLPWYNYSPCAWNLRSGSTMAKNRSLDKAVRVNTETPMDTSLTNSDIVHMVLPHGHDSSV